MHVLVEMDAKVKAVEYLVFDEADRYWCWNKYKFFFENNEEVVQNSLDLYYRPFQKNVKTIKCYPQT